MKKEDRKTILVTIALWVLFVVLGTTLWIYDEEDFSQPDREPAGTLRELILHGEHGNDTLYVDERGVVIDFVITKNK